MHIEKATPEQFRELIEFLIGRFHAEYSEWFPPVDVDKVIRHVGNFIEHGVVFVARSKDGQMAGVISGVLTAPWFSSVKLVTDGFFYVAPEFRSTRAATALVRTLKVWSAEQGIEELNCSVISGDDIDRKDRFFERNGFRRIGGIYRWRVTEEKEV